MKAKYLLDTVILIDHLNGIPQAGRWLLSLKEKEAVISVVTLAEVLAGAEKTEKDSVQLLLSFYDCLSLTPSAAIVAAELRHKHHLKLPDAFQAALAVEHGLVLCTRNTRDFSAGKFDFVNIPYQISG